jgi:O-methyltransferase involved in polyketide biosynthesis
MSNNDKTIRPPGPTDQPSTRHTRRTPRVPHARGGDPMTHARVPDLWYGGERHDVAPYLGGHGWQTARFRSGQLLADAGLPAPQRNDGQTENYYCTAQLGAR